MTTTLPPHGTPIHANPGAFRQGETVALAAVIEPPVDRAVWYLDGKPIGFPLYPYTAPLPLVRGEPVIQARVPLPHERPPLVRVTME